jgi:hypothetical protein
VNYTEAEALALAVIRKTSPAAVPARRYAREDATSFLVGWEDPDAGDFPEDAPFVFVAKVTGAVTMAGPLESLERVSKMARVS